MDYRRPPLSSFPRPSPFASVHEPRNTPLHPHLPGPSPSIPANRSQQPYDPLSRRDHDLVAASSRVLPPQPPSSVPAPPLVFASQPPSTSPSHTFHHEILSHPSRSPGPFPPASSIHPEPPSSLHRRHQSRGSLLGHGGLLREPGATYLEAPGPSPSIPREMSHPPQPFDQTRRRSLGGTDSPPIFSSESCSLSFLALKVAPVPPRPTRRTTRKPRLPFATPTQHCLQLTAFLSQAHPLSLCYAIISFNLIFLRISLR